jgi:hypothetical protein
MSAHYDSCRLFGSTRAPGANDNGLHPQSARTCNPTDEPPALQGPGLLYLSLSFVRFLAREFNPNPT